MCSGFSRGRSAFYARSAGVALVLALALTACDKVPLVAPSNSSITLTSATRTLATGGTTTLTAMVAESNGSVVQNGTTVHFTTTLGSVSPVDALTTNGIATATFSAGDSSGVAEVRATSGTNGGGTSSTTTGTTTTTTSSASNVLQITIGAAAVNSVTVSASPSTVASTGGTVSIVASALDANGNRLVAVPISFSTDVGSLSATSAVTDSAGNATVQLTTTQPATVTASAGSKTGTVKVTVNTAATVTISVSPNPATVGQSVTLTITPASGTTSHVVVNWGDGNSDDLGVVAGSGRTAAHSYSTAGNYTITATATSGSETFTTSTPITVNARGTVLLSVDKTTGTVTTTFTFTVTPSSGGAIRDVTLDFGDNTSRDFGGITSATTATHVYSSTGTYKATATETDADGHTSTASVTIIVS